MYSNPPDDNFYQGDVFKNCKFFLPPPTSDTISPASAVVNISVGGFNLQERLYTGNAVILTQTCDIEDNEFVHLATVIPKQQFTELLLASKKEQPTIDSILGKLSSKRTHYKEIELFQWFFLPSTGFFDDSIVQLHMMGMINKRELSPTNRIAHLSDRGRHWLQYYLIRFWGRPFYWEEPLSNNG